jgi:hypothetical protein
MFEIQTKEARLEVLEAQMVVQELQVKLKAHQGALVLALRLRKGSISSERSR